jgi:hypothetical protein
VRLAPPPRQQSEKDVVNVLLRIVLGRLQGVTCVYCMYKHITNSKLLYCTLCLFRSVASKPSGRC